MNVPPLHVAMVGPLAPPAGGMANQTEQLAELLGKAGIELELVCVNPSYPAWVADMRGWRALVRLLGYLPRLWRAAGKADLMHVMANSGWSWHLFSAPAIWIAWLRRRPVLLHYHGGQAAQFLERQPRLIAISLRRVQTILVPSAYLARIFGRHGYRTTILPNLVELERFQPGAGPEAGHWPTLLVARNLEPVYDIATALHAFAAIRQTLPRASLRIAGSGEQEACLRALAQELDVADAVHFAGRVAHADMPGLYRRADVLLNPSLVDNQPVSILEALACGVPVVSTRVGGIPDLLCDGVSGLLVEPGDYLAMAGAALSLLCDPVRSRQMVEAGRKLLRRHDSAAVRERLLRIYRQAQHRRAGAWWTGVLAGLVFPLHERLKGQRSPALRRQLEQSQWWTPRQLAGMQLDRLRLLLVQAQAHVPYYRALFARCCFAPERIDNLEQLARLPILRKADMRAHADDFRSDQAGALKRCSTGGSSGEPLVFFLGKDRVSRDVAAKWRATRWWGVDIGAPELVVWGSPIELQAQDHLRALRDRLLRTRLLPAFDLGTAKLDEYVARIRAERPAMLFGYPSALSVIARHAQARRIALDRLGIEVVFVTSERLYPEQRALIETVFGCPAANGYGGRDAGFVAHECPEGGMHISAEDIIVEIVDPQGKPLPPGALGEIVVTHLGTADYPFIRYGTGDIGALDPLPCACGRGLPLLKQLEGRSTDFIHAQDGTVMHGLALIYILRELPQIRAFKIVQESRELTRVLIVAMPALSPDVRAGIETRFRARLGAQVLIVIDEVDAIAPEASGKFRYVISHVAQP